MDRDRNIAITKNVCIYPTAFMRFYKSWSQTTCSIHRRIQHRFSPLSYDKRWATTGGL